MADYIPKPDGMALAYFKRVTVAFAMSFAAFNRADGWADSLVAKVATFEAKLADVDAAKAALTTAVAAKDAARLAVENELRPTVQLIQLDALVTDATRLDAGLPVRDTIRTTSAPTPALELVATPSADGTNALKWKSGANAAGVRFEIQAKVGTAAGFSTVDVVTATSFVHKNQTPGVRVEYRVVTRRGDLVAAASNPATVY
jgi:hypothetical protein